MSLRFLRFVSDAEFAEFRANRRLLPSRKSWPPYSPADNVVFLFYEDKISAADLLAYVDQHVEARGPLHLLRITFNLLSVHRIMPDESNIQPVSVVHRGPIVESENVRIDYLARFHHGDDPLLLL